MKSRRNFIKLTGTGVLAAGVIPINASVFAAAGAAREADKFSVGMAGYTFYKLSIDKTIEIMKRVEVSNISIKDIHMALNSSQEQITSVIEKFKGSGLNVYTVGVIYMKTKESVDQAFEYARMAGVKMIVGAPDYEFLPYVEEKVKSHDIRLAIHNHGPDNALYPNAADIWDHIKDLDSRIGICIDIGHTTRDGQDPSADIMKYKTRIFDIHIKDVDKATKEGKTVEIGRGIIDIPKFVDTIRKIKYSGSCSLEFEKDMDDPIAGIAESIGYFKGVMACNM